jgi:hypothetical protein
MDQLRDDGGRDRAWGAVSPPFENELDDAQEAAGILLLRVALALLGEARLRGNFGDDAELAEQATALAAEFDGGVPSPHLKRPPIEGSLLRPDRISLSAPFGEGGSIVESLGLDGILFDGGTALGVTSKKVEPKEMNPEERADLERRQAKWRAEQERRRGSPPPGSCDPSPLPRSRARRCRSSRSSFSKTASTSSSPTTRSP